MSQSYTSWSPFRFSSSISPTHLAYPYPSTPPFSLRNFRCLYNQRLRISVSLKRKLIRAHPSTTITNSRDYTETHEDRHGPADLVKPVLIPMYSFGLNCISLCVFCHSTTSYTRPPSSFRFGDNYTRLPTLYFFETSSDSED